MKNENSDERIYCWGFGKYGQIGEKMVNYSLEPIQSNINYIKEEMNNDIAGLYAGEAHNTILTLNHLLYSYGKNIFGELGLGHTNNTFIPTMISFQLKFKEKIIKVSLGGEHSLALTCFNELYAWGLNIFGQLGSGDFISKSKPTIIPFPNQDKDGKIIDISAGAHHSLLLTNYDNLYSCGYADNNSLGYPSPNHSNSFSKITFSKELIQFNTIAMISSGVYHSCCLYSNQTTMIIWGKGAVLEYSEPVMIDINNTLLAKSHHSVIRHSMEKPINKLIKEVRIGEDFIMLLTKDKEVYAWGSNSHGQLGLGGTNDELSMKKVEICPIEEIKVGYQHVIGITSGSKEMYGWGSNEYGQLGIDGATSYSKPILLEELNRMGVRKIACGGHHNIALCDNDDNDKELKISKLASTLKKDLSPLIKQIDTVDSINKRIMKLEMTLKSKDAEINKLRIEEQSLDTIISINSRKNNQLINREDSDFPKSSHDNNPSKFTNDFIIPLTDITFPDKSELGKGTFGEVKRGTWRGIEVAVKFLKMSLMNNPNSLQSFIKECTIMKNLHHPNILLFMGANTSLPNLYIVTEYCPNKNLFDYLHTKKPKATLSWKDICRLALEIAYGMNYLHSFNPPILHRDLKSMNILLDKRLTVKIGDFGNTKSLDSQMTLQKGTFQWMAPEVIKGEKYTEKSDVFSFGIIMNELITRRPPYEHIDKREVARQVATNASYRPAYDPASASSDWISLMTRCYQQNECDRPSFDEIIDLLQSAKLNI